MTNEEMITALAERPLFAEQITFVQGLAQKDFNVLKLPAVVGFMRDNPDLLNAWLKAASDAYNRDWAQYIKATPSHRMNFATAKLLVAALILFNDRARFGPRNHRLALDSYQLAADITTALQAAGWSPYDPTLQPPTN